MLNRVIFGLSDACLLASKLAVVGMTLLTATDVVLRMLIRFPVPGAYELVGMLGAMAVAGALPHVQRTGAFIFVETITEYLADTAKRRLRAFTLGVEGVFFFLLAMQFVLASGAMLRSRQVTEILQMPQWVVYAAVSVGMVVVTIVAFAQFVSIIRGRAA